MTEEKPDAELLAAFATEARQRCDVIATGLDTGTSGQGDIHWRGRASGRRTLALAALRALGIDALRGAAEDRGRPPAAEGGAAGSRCPVVLAT